jgi:hypothetical protein
MRMTFIEKEKPAAKENRLMDESGGSLLCIEVHREVEYDYYTGKYLPEWDRIFGEYGELRLLFYYPEPELFIGWDERAAEMDFERHLQRGREVRRVALINPPDQVRARWHILKALIGGELRVFDPEEREAALAWVKPSLDGAG